jgi:hypothetical protein
MINNFIYNFNNPEIAYSAIIVILSIGLIISSLEELVAFSVYNDSGLLSWKISKHRSSFFLKGNRAKILNFILSDLQFHAILFVKAILSVLLLLAPFFKVFPAILIFSIFVLMLLTLLRSPFGLDGAYQMNLVVLFGLSIATLSGIYSTLASICLWFIAGELILSYFIAGLAKMVSPIWRKSHALPAIFSTKTYGHEGVFQLVMKHKIFSIVLCWPVLIFELLFVSALFSGNLCFFLCIIGFLFHFFNAAFMGLNTFLFSFLSTYPALFYCCSKINLLWNVLP